MKARLAGWKRPEGDAPVENQNALSTRLGEGNRRRRWRIFHYRDARSSVWPSAIGPEPLCPLSRRAVQRAQPDDLFAIQCARLLL